MPSKRRHQAENDSLLPVKKQRLGEPKQSESAFLLLPIEIRRHIYQELCKKPDGHVLEMGFPSGMYFYRSGKAFLNPLKRMQYPFAEEMYNYPKLILTCSQMWQEAIEFLYPDKFIYRMDFAFLPCHGQQVEGSVS